MSTFHLGWMDACAWYHLTTLLSTSYYMDSSHVLRTKHVKGMECNVPMEV
jgi:hypothetical protein